MLRTNLDGKLGIDGAEHVNFSFDKNLYEIKDELHTLVFWALLGIIDLLSKK